MKIVLICKYCGYIISHSIEKNFIEKCPCCSTEFSSDVFLMDALLEKMCNTTDRLKNITIKGIYTENEINHIHFQ